LEICPQLVKIFQSNNLKNSLNSFIRVAMAIGNSTQTFKCPKAFFDGAREPILE
jgi:hypothetical protein